MARWLRNTWKLGLKELFSLRADPVMLGLVVYVFSFAVYSVAAGAKLEVENASVAYVDLDRSALTGASSARSCRRSSRRRRRSRPARSAP